MFVTNNITEAHLAIPTTCLPHCTSLTIILSVFLLLFSWVVVVVAALPFSFLGRRKITDNKCHEKYQYNNKVQGTPSIIDDLYG